MKILLIGGTGVVGSEVQKELIKRNKYQVRVLTTSPEKASALPSGVEGIVGNVDDAASLEKAFQGINAVFMVNQHTLTEVEQGKNVINAAVKANVKKFVYQSIHLTRNAPHVDHFRSKALLEDAIMESGLNYVFISPNNFYQNDHNFFRQAVTDYQLYIQPLGSVGVSRVDVRDIAVAVANVLQTTDFDGKNVALVGPEALTAEQTAHILTDVLGYQVNYVGDDLGSFKETLYPFVPKWQVDDWADMYGFFQKDGLKATKAEVAQLTILLGRKPRSYREYLQDYQEAFRQTATV